MTPVITKAAQMARYRAANPDAYRGYRMKNKYGITLEQYNEMLERQNGVCAICEQDETRTARGIIRSLAVDHDHETGEVRGLLCASCNQILGFARDNPEVLRSAATYLDLARGR